MKGTVWKTALESHGTMERRSSKEQCRKLYAFSLLGFLCCHRLFHTKRFSKLGWAHV